MIIKYDNGDVCSLNDFKKMWNNSFITETDDISEAHYFIVDGVSFMESFNRQNGTQKMNTFDEFMKEFKRVGECYFIDDLVGMDTFIYRYTIAT